MAALTRLARKRAEKAKSSLRALKFDELNVKNETETLYAELDRDCRAAYRELYIDRYTELWFWMKGKNPDEDLIDELVEMELAGLLDGPNETTHYIWSNEVLRKQKRLEEAILASPSSVQKQLEIDKAVRIWLQMAGWYTDFVSQDAEIQAFKDAGVKKVQRHEMKDDRVCEECRDADGTIYEIDKIPPLPHLRCRRYFTPA